MMPSVVVSIKMKVVEAHQAGEPAEHFIKHRSCKSRPMYTLMHRSKHGYDHKTMDDHSWDHQPEIGTGEIDQDAGEDHHADMRQCANDSLNVGTSAQRANYGDLKNSPGQGRRSHVRSIKGF